MPLKAPAPALSSARRAIEVAFKDLEKTISPADSRDFAATTLDDVRKAAVDLERQLAARQSLRNMQRLEPLFQGLNHYSKVIDVLCNGTDYLPWIWAPIKLVLKISSDYIEAFERIIKAYSLIAESLGRFQLLERSFQGKPHLYPVFVVFYADILKFHKAAYRFITRRSWKTFFMTTWGRFEREFGATIEDLKRHGELIDKEVNAHNIVESRAMREALQSWRTESLERLAQEQREQTARQMQGVITWLRIDDSEQNVLLDSLTKIGQAHPGTVEWVLKKPQMASWLRTTTETPFLWLQGGPGTGKSVIVARLVSFLGVPKCGLGGSHVVRHFCSYTHESSTQYDQIVKSLLLQCVQSDGDLVAHIYEEYIGSKQATLPVLEKLLELSVGFIQTQRSLHILLDGLDECSPDKQQRLVRLMDRLVSSSTTCKVLVSSQDSAAIQSRLKRKSLLALSEEKECLKTAISNYAALRLRGMRQKLSELGISEDSVGGIATHVGERADGIFLWACLVLNYLSANFFYSGAEFMDAIDALPHELSSFYEKLLSRILSDLDRRSALRLRSIFSWIAFAKRPLRKAELQSALLFQTDNTVASRPVPAHILEACKPIVEERRNSTFAFIHISVRDYLQSESCQRSIRIDSESVLWDHGSSSFRCLRMGLDVFRPDSEQRERNLQVIRGAWGFLPYAAEFWCVYLRDMALTPIGGWDSSCRDAIARLSSHLSALEPDLERQLPALLMEELDPIRQFPAVWYDATVALQSRSSGQHRGTEGSDDQLVLPKSTQHVFLNYEITIRQIMTDRERWDSTASEFELFKENFSGHAYLCRFISCPHSITGFDNSETRAAHEAGHTPTFPCLVANCQYPPFCSSRALRKHSSDVHQIGAERRRVHRPISNWASSRRSGMPPLKLPPLGHYSSQSPDSQNMAKGPVPDRSISEQVIQPADNQFDVLDRIRSEFSQSRMDINSSYIGPASVPSPRILPEKQPEVQDWVFPPSQQIQQHPNEIGSEFQSDLFDGFGRSSLLPYEGPLPSSSSTVIKAKQQDDDTLPQYGPEDVTSVTPLVTPAEVDASEFNPLRSVRDDVGGANRSTTKIRAKRTKPLTAMELRKPHRVSHIRRHHNAPLEDHKHQQQQLVQSPQQQQQSQSRQPDTRGDNVSTHRLPYRAEEEQLQDSSYYSDFPRDSGYADYNPFKNTEIGEVLQQDPLHLDTSDDNISSKSNIGESLGEDSGYSGYPPHPSGHWRKQNPEQQVQQTLAEPARQFAWNSGPGTMDPSLENSPATFESSPQTGVLSNYMNRDSDGIQENDRGLQQPSRDTNDAGVHSLSERQVASDGRFCDPIKPDAKQPAFVKRWMCKEPPLWKGRYFSVIPISDCWMCVGGKKYRTYNDAAEHLTSTHFIMGDLLPSASLLGELIEEVEQPADMQEQHHGLFGGHELVYESWRSDDGKDIPLRSSQVFPGDLPPTTANITGPTPPAWGTYQKQTYDPYDPATLRVAGALEMQESTRTQVVSNETPNHDTGVSELVLRQDAPSGGPPASQQLQHAPLENSQTRNVVSSASDASGVPVTVSDLWLDREEIGKLLFPYEVTKPVEVSPFDIAHARTTYSTFANFGDQVLAQILLILKKDRYIAQQAAFARAMAATVGAKTENAGVTEHNPFEAGFSAQAGQAASSNTAPKKSLKEWTDADIQGYSEHRQRSEEERIANLQRYQENLQRYEEHMGRLKQKPTSGSPRAI
ncbi:hypothetical protein QBC47DRAFT_394073 [Echria macrotheca]|uniref:NACHT domain-containing protein n=1 Tax=Echria macrotheca TaxID=438768 RepID=A0AAJ0B3D2_9PEZI|nr:hypothetical protein QBC47DRAFT_394073 [Echria macrotheca]